MAHPPPRAGIALAFVCLVILGVMPIVANSRPAAFDALSFAFFLSIWQLLASLPLLVWELRSANTGLFQAHLTPALRRRTLAIILLTGAIFGLSTYVYVLAVEKAGAVSAAIAIQAYPLFAILWETLFLKRRKTTLELLFTVMMVAALYALATEGTGRIAGFSPWFAVALGVPFLWSVAHVIIKEVLDRTPITPAQVTFLRVLVSVAILGVLLTAILGPARILADLRTIEFQVFALVMGVVYYLELIVWFYAVRSIDVSVASSVTVPWPALTMVLAVPLLGETVEGYQVVTLCVIAASLYGLLFAGTRKRRAAVPDR
ncbi:DMT family transporter [Roseospira visakhapatnamensis]|uniref:Drug/metabolite transporter (DMT)-like permease n=1 Tax=Roseospira visakhapatnamensis TaxID=390880 RepID=A0A7W6REC2_9PROT|nr:DMT family transporter [Roseospira visakhapatnamensis]MBB4266368.1 drug/metabolite transporter (DMT)-like permease [Roseospira visakhapatnamensis]